MKAVKAEERLDRLEEAKAKAQKVTTMLHNKAIAQHRPIKGVHPRAFVRVTADLVPQRFPSFVLLKDQSYSIPLNIDGSSFFYRAFVKTLSNN